MSLVALLATVTATIRERERAAAVLASRFAPRFNAVTLLGPGENAISSVFRWMLDEQGDHGQGGAFRDLFLQMFVPEVADTADWSGSTVMCEVMTQDGGRIDLLLTARDGACIAIENKPWAGWQDRQLERYHDDCARQGNPVWVHALIGGIGDAVAELDRHWKNDRAPGPVSSRPSTITASNYLLVTAWIDGCAAISRAERVRNFLLEFADYCRQTILQEPTMAQSDEDAELIIECGSTGIIAAYTIAAALPRIVVLLCEQTAAAVNAGMKEHGWSALACQVSGNERGVELTSANGDVLTYAILGTGNGLQPWVGLKSAASQRREHPTTFPHGPWKDWPHWAWLDTRRFNFEEVVRAASDGRLATMLIGDADHRLVALRDPVAIP